MSSKPKQGNSCSSIGNSFLEKQYLFGQTRVISLTLAAHPKLKIVASGSGRGCGRSITTKLSVNEYCTLFRIAACLLKNPCNLRASLRSIEHVSTNRGSLLLLYFRRTMPYDEVWFPKILTLFRNNRVSPACSHCSMGAQQIGRAHV